MALFNLKARLPEVEVQRQSERKADQQCAERYGPESAHAKRPRLAPENYQAERRAQYQIGDQPRCRRIRKRRDHEIRKAEAARDAVDLVLAGHEPYPAIAIDRHWTLIASNKAVQPLLAAVDPLLLQPPINALRLSLHPAGLAPRIANLAEWRSHLLARLRRQIEVTADPVLEELLNELSSYPAPSEGVGAGSDGEYAGVAAPFRLVTEQGVLSFISATTIFGTPVDVTLSELALESFFPADAATAKALRGRR